MSIHRINSMRIMRLIGIWQKHGLCHDSKKNEDLNSAGYLSHFW